jgi:hypothetical protein
MLDDCWPAAYIWPFQPQLGELKRGKSTSIDRRLTLNSNGGKAMHVIYIQLVIDQR